jgi:UDPglucose--hexose-1-phosphate uridylyltransferase
MSVIRQDPTTKEWVIFSTERAKRPDQFKRNHSPINLPPYQPSCPFCPGNETLTPLEILRLPSTENGSWDVRVIPNKFPVLQGTGEATRREAGPLFREMDGVGSHEVIIETPIHNQRMAMMKDHEVERILTACQMRYCILEKDPRIKSIIIFKNHGEHAGTSLEHPHIQLVATPVAPMLMRQKYEVAISHYDDTGRCLYGDLVAAELEAHVRVLFETDGFVVFHPYASRLPFETWITPRHMQSSFGQISPDDLAELASVLRRTLSGLDAALHNPHFNFVIHSASAGDQQQDYYLWHIQILPRLTTIAGFELGSGIFINTMMPEESANFLRKFCS